MSREVIAIAAATSSAASVNRAKVVKPVHHGAPGCVTSKSARKSGPAIASRGSATMGSATSSVHVSKGTRSRYTYARNVPTCATVVRRASTASVELTTAENILLQLALLITVNTE